MYDIKNLNDSKQNHLADALPHENKLVAEQQESNAQTFCDRIIEEATDVNKQLLELRDKVFDHVK